MVEVDIITGEKQQRRWSLEEKRSILAAAFAPGGNVKAFARRAGISTGQLYTWRKQLRQAALMAPDGFSRVMAVQDAAPIGMMQAECAPVSITPHPAAPDRNGKRQTIVIEVRGKKARIPGSIPPELAAAVVSAMVKA